MEQERWNEHWSWCLEYILRRVIFIFYLGYVIRFPSYCIGFWANTNSTVCRKLERESIFIGWMGKCTAVRKVYPRCFTIGLLWIETPWLYYVHKETQDLLIHLDIFNNLNLSSIEYLSKINRVLLCKTAELRYILFSIWNY